MAVGLLPGEHPWVALRLAQQIGSGRPVISAAAVSLHGKKHSRSIRQAAFLGLRGQIQPSGSPRAFSSQNISSRHPAQSPVAGDPAPDIQQSGHLCPAPATAPGLPAGLGPSRAHWLSGMGLPSDLAQARGPHWRLHKWLWVGPLIPVSALAWAPGVGTSVLEQDAWALLGAHLRAGGKEAARSTSQGQPSQEPCGLWVGDMGVAAAIWLTGDSPGSEGTPQSRSQLPRFHGRKGGAWRRHCCPWC